MTILLLLILIAVTGGIAKWASDFFEMLGAVAKLIGAVLVCVVVGPFLLLGAVCVIGSSTPHYKWLPHCDPLNTAIGSTIAVIVLLLGLIFFW